MSQFLADGMPVAELTTIRRQRDAELRKSVEQASQGKAGAAARALDLLEEQHRLIEIPDVKERYSPHRGRLSARIRSGTSDPRGQPRQR